MSNQYKCKKTGAVYALKFFPARMGGDCSKWYGVENAGDCVTERQFDLPSSAQSSLWAMLDDKSITPIASM